ncbi:hypothetical protein Pla144_35480 [Bythopirellula polymerisocia]|uniref:Uncharacterized protein n=1 Tax=Bythopirellula polymerisocia TaxID=2528003 RepID=A0A5C6CJW1_9BACT|nr:hypothetical protein Pla144_35480 [Bythopirellula polymerisocia]
MVVALLAWNLVTGCTSWQNSSPPGLGNWSNERRTLQEAKNDPFPSPGQVGIK